MWPSEHKTYENKLFTYIQIAKTNSAHCLSYRYYLKYETINIDFELKKVLLPPLGNFADISYLKENFKPHLLRDVCTLCSGALVSDSMLHMIL